MKNIWTGQDLGNLDKFVEDDKPRVIVVDHLPPEANAVALAKYSRSIGSFLSRLVEINKGGWEQFMKRFYVGYGHNSVGDGGDTTACIENVSMLAAVAYEHYHNSAWQEISTRYNRMTNGRVVNPLGTDFGRDIQSQCMSLYTFLMEIMPDHVRTQFPRKPEQTTEGYESTILSKSCDVAGAFLPAGAMTSVGRRVSLRDLRQHLITLRNYPLEEVRTLANMLATAAAIQYPSSGFDRTYTETEAYAARCAQSMFNFNPIWPELDTHHTFELSSIRRYDKLLQNRPEKALLPDFLNTLGQIYLDCKIDFRSFRDLHRHCRSGAMQMPLLTTQYGFEDWYMKQIPERPRGLVQQKLQKIRTFIEDLDCTDEVRQYYTPMGFKVAVDASWTLGPAVYIADLRTGQTVHPTVRVIAQHLGETLQQIIPTLKLYCDFGPDIWNIKRGEQAHTEKKAS